MAAMTQYTAVCRRSGDWWAINVPEVRGVHTQARRLDQVEAMTRDAIALFLDVAPDSLAIEVRPEVPGEVTEALSAREAAASADKRATEALRRAIRWLLDHDYTVRDAGRLLNLSAQRISQLTSVSRSTPKPDNDQKSKPHRGSSESRTYMPMKSGSATRKAATPARSRGRVARPSPATASAKRKTK